MLSKVRYSTPKKPLSSIYKALLRTHLGYFDVIYGKPCNEKFKDTLESIRYNDTLAITDAIKGTSKENLYDELGVEYLGYRKWTGRLCLFNIIFNLKSPK